MMKLIKFAGIAISITPSQFNKINESREYRHSSGNLFEDSKHLGFSDLFVKSGFSKLEDNQEVTYTELVQSGVSPSWIEDMFGLGDYDCWLHQYNFSQKLKRSALV